MLKREANAAARAAGVEERVRQLIAETAGFRDEEGAVLELPLDSLTLLGIATMIEAVFEVELEGAEIAALLGARDTRAIAALVARKVAAAQAKLDESAGN